MDALDGPNHTRSAIAEGVNLEDDNMMEINGIWASLTNAGLVGRADVGELAFLDGDSPVYDILIVRDENGDLVHHAQEELSRMTNSDIKIFYIEFRGGQFANVDDESNHHFIAVVKRNNCFLIIDGALGAIMLKTDAQGLEQAFSNDQNLGVLEGLLKTPFDADEAG